MPREKEKLLQERSRAESEVLYCIAGIPAHALVLESKAKNRKRTISDCVDVNKFLLVFCFSKLFF